MKWNKEIFIVTESNPNQKDLYNQPVLKTTLFENENECNIFVNKLIDDYINLYVECWNDEPRLLRFNDEKNKFYYDKITWYLERDNIIVKKSIRTFEK